MMHKTKWLFLIIATILFSYFYIPKSLFWDPINYYGFKGLNSLLGLGKLFQFLFACLNHRYNDWVVDAVFLAFFISYVKQKNAKPALLKIIESLLIISVMLFVIFVINKQLFRYVIQIESISPSLKYSPYFNLDELFKVFSTKIYSTDSYPGDHATTAIIFYLLLAPLLKKPQTWYLASYCFLIILPRLVLGAHNISDIVAGSLPIALSIASALYYRGFLEKTALFVYSRVFIEKKARNLMMR